MSKKKILLLSDDLRMHSGIATQSKEFVMGTIHKYDWVQLGGAVKHPEEGKIMDMSQSLDLVDEHGYIQNHVDIIRDKVNEMAIVLPEQEDDIELEIPGDESSATVDKKVQAKATRQDKIIRDFQRIQKQMQTHLEMYKDAEGDEAKKLALQMLKNLTPEFQAAKKKYEKLKGVKI